MPYPETATGFQAQSAENWSTFKLAEYDLKPFEDDDVDIAVDACGVCGSDVHTITGGWGEVPMPLCVGHEIVGKAVKIGKNVKDIKVGDRVGVGAQISADMTCVNCKNSQENYCPNAVDTYGAPYGPKGTISQGGYASHVRAHQYFTFKIPENIPDAIAAPMLCAGLTVYSPLVRLGCGPGKKVAIIGVGGLGHFAIMWASALGAEVYVISHSPSKKEDAMKMGAHHFITNDKEDWAKPYAFAFDFILNTADMTHEFNLPDYFSTLKVMGKFHNVGMPDEPVSINLQAFASNGCYIGTSHIGNREEMLAMFKLASTQNIKTWVETIPISEAGCKKAVEGVKNNKVRYRYTLVDYDAVFGKRY